MAPSWLDVLDETTRVSAAHGRSDLIHWLRHKRAQLLDPRLRVLVIGEPGQGKSQLINALVNASACPVGDGSATAVPTVVQYAEAPSATLVRTPPPPGAAAGEPAPPEERVALVGDQVSAGIGGKLPSRPGAGTSHVEIGVPRGLLASGIVLIDTPGVDGEEPSRSPGTLAAFARADLVLMVSDATRELSVTELNLLLHLAQSHANVVVAQTKIDLASHWHDVADANRRHLAGAGLPCGLIPVSAALRLRAARTNDEAINAESGFPELVARLARDRAGKGDALARANVGLIARTVIEQLAAPLRAELSAQVPAEASGPMSRLHHAQRAVDELRRCSVRWQNTLGDEMADLASDLEYDLRDRTRGILRKVDEAFDTADPLTGWDTFEEWLEHNLTEAAEANFAWLAERCDWITHRIAATFAGYGQDVLPGWSVRVPDDLADRVPAIERPQIDRFTAIQKAYTALRGSYGGLLMFGLATSMAGMPLVNAVSLGAGALFGGKSVRDESKSLLKRRQAAAKAAAQRHVDDFFIRLNKEGKDTVRQVQRVLRDHFAALTEELQEAIVQSFRSAKQEADADAAVREQRHREIEQQMKRLAALYEGAQELSAGRVGTGRARLGSPL
jgi:tRNA U34 5-carboxymethylaminomethyl modifying GTPase MnmE/TrmE